MLKISQKIKIPYVVVHENHNINKTRNLSIKKQLPKELRK
jgi:hypothetical protein